MRTPPKKPSQGTCNKLRDNMRKQKKWKVSKSARQVIIFARVKKMFMKYPDFLNL